MRKLRRTIALYLILTLGICAFSSFSNYALGADPQGQTPSDKSAPEPSPDPWAWIWVLIYVVF